MPVITTTETVADDGTIYLEIHGEPVLTADNPVWQNQQNAGVLPEFLRTSDPRPAREQLEAGYGYPRDWRSSWRLEWISPTRFRLHDTEYPEDQPLEEIARTKLRDEFVVLFELGFVAVFERALSPMVTRMD